MTETSVKIEEILYEGLVGIADPREREEFLNLTCTANPGLRARLEKLIALHDEAERFFAQEPEFDSSTFTAPSESAPTPDGNPDEGIETRIGRYRLLECLGAGGCGVVYLAEQMEPVRRRVALKIIRVGMDTEHIIARFETERQTLALMDHPNIARVLDAGATAAGRPFFVMQLVDGPRITEYCDQNRLDIPARLKLFIAVCRAIQHAHQKGIIHCDIKPSNLLVTRHDGVAVPKVIDFGIAKAMEASHADVFAPASSLPIGTPAYMSPEQVNGDGLDVDSRSDIYSLGVVLYELLAGMPPRDPEIFSSPEPETIHRTLHGTPVAKPSIRLACCPPETLRQLAANRRMEPARLVRMLRGDLDAIIGKAMRIDRKLRYGTANELAEDISRFLDNEPVNARGSPRGYRLGKLVRRNKIVFAAGAIAMIALTGGFGTSTWLFFREARARHEQALLREAAEKASAIEANLRRRAQAGEAVAHAAVLIRDGDLAQADKLLDQIALDDVPASLESAAVFRAVGEWLLPQGRPADAARRQAALAQAISRVDKSNSESVSIHFVAAAAALVDAGDIEHYEDLRQMAVERFSAATHPYIMDEIVKSCLIMPACPELLAKLEPMVEVLKSNLPWDRQASPAELMEGWQMLSITLAAYRTGDHPLALEWARRCLKHPNVNPSRNATIHAIIAMAQHHTGRTEDARVALETARSAVTAHFQQPFQHGGPETGYWFDWVIARILLKEAEGVEIVAQE
jgi:serine/threonine protein kinase